MPEPVVPILGSRDALIVADSMLAGQLCTGGRQHQGSPDERQGDV